MAKTPTPESSLGLTLEGLRQLLWGEFKQYQFLLEVCRQMRYGEIRIQVHDGRMKEIHVDLRFRDGEPG